jgi:hypothetical protein
VGLQRGFAAFIAPLHAGVAALLPPLATLSERMAVTRAMWDACETDADLEEEVLRALNPLE